MSFAGSDVLDEGTLAPIAVPLHERLTRLDFDLTPLRRRPFMAVPCVAFHL
jgi:hypothetical protein